MKAPRLNVGCTAVRKNRYVILPADFEEAWKVGVWLCHGFVLLSLVFSLAYESFLLQQTVKRSDETHEFCTSIPSSVYPPYSSMIWHVFTTRSIKCMDVMCVFSQLVFVLVSLFLQQ